MSQGYVCKCPESQKPMGERKWGVIQRFCNYSAFNGYQRTASDYSALMCLGCGVSWRTKANYVNALRSVTIDPNKHEWVFIDSP